MDMEGVSALIKGCGEEMTVWNKVSFGHVNQKLQEARRHLLGMQNLDSIQPKTVGLRESQKNVQVWLEWEEVLWQQGLRI